ncbi:MAG: BlaI/MecI/CopY family transcriptional regulator [Pseudomonadales bacterium]|nr:BlaI/MecI/CopY family transcriptional regulator [Pseudomonadales bacterium]
MSKDSRLLGNWFGVRRPRARMPVLGERELATLEALWLHPASTAQEIIDHAKHWKVSLSTVQSTLERLHRKGLASRTKHFRAYRYEAVVTRSEIISSLLHDMMEEISGGDMAPVVSGFVDFLGSDPSGVDRLLEMMQRQGSAAPDRSERGEGG